MSETVAEDIKIPTDLKGKPAQIDAYRAIATAEEPIRPSEISEKTGRSIDSTNRAVGKMKEQSLIKRVDHGLYTLPSHEDTSGAPKDELQSIQNSEVAELLQRTTKMEIHTDARVSAGDGRIVYPDSKTHIVELPRGLLAEVLGFQPPQRIGITRAEGDSMKPTIRDEDLIIYEPSRDGIPSSGIYLLHMEYGMVVKRVQPLSDGSYHIISDNTYDGYENEMLVPADDNDHLVKEATGRPAEMRPVGKVIFPDRSTDQMHVKQVSEIIKQALGRNGEAQKAMAR